MSIPEKSIKSVLEEYKMPKIDLNTPEHRVSVRLRDLDQKISKITSKLFDYKPEIRATRLTKNFSDSPASTTSRGKPIIEVPYVFLLKTEEMQTMVNELGFKDFNDPQISTDENLEKIDKSIKDFFNISKSNKLDMFEKEFLKGFIKFISNSELSEKAKNATLVHEIAHILHGDIYDETSIQNSILSRSSLATACVISAATFCASRISSPYISVFFGLVALSANVGFRAFSAIKHMQAYEKRADLTLSQFPEHIEGDIYFYKTTRDHQATLFKRGWIFSLYFTSTGDERFPTSHPTDSQRIEYLTELLEQSK